MIKIKQKMIKMNVKIKNEVKDDEKINKYEKIEIKTKIIRATV